MNNLQTFFKVTIVFTIVLIFNNYSFSQVGWYVQSSGTLENLNAIQFADGNTGYAVGNAGIVLKTINAGNNWSVIANFNNSNNTSISVVNANSIYIGRENGNILFTTNGGTNWFTSLLNAPYTLNSIYYTSTSVGFTCGADYSLYRTTNGGQKWYNSPIGHTGTIMKVYFINSSIGWVLDSYTNSGVTANSLHYTNDGGNNWTSNIPIPSNVRLNSLHYISSTLGYIAGNNGSIFKTENGGVNWTSQTSNITQNLKSVVSTDLSKVYAVGEQGKVLYTSNGGSNWVSQTSNTTNSLNSVYFAPNSSTGWACGNSGTILKTTTGGVGIRNLNSELPNSFKLYQNYPNPFNPETNIKFDLIKNSNVKLSVFDIKGKELYTLLDQPLSIGSYEYKFDGSKLSSGIYFYKIKTDNFESVGKMILSK